MTLPIKEITKSEIIFLYFKEIPKNYPDYKNIQKYFNACEAKNINPKLAENRQIFNDIYLKKSKRKCLIGRYGEDRISLLKDSSLEKEKRTLHLGIDFFTKKSTDVFSIENGEIVRLGREKEKHSYGYYAIIKHNINNKIFYSFYGHLAKHTRSIGNIKKGEKVGILGNKEENGDWSIHLHFQILKTLPKNAPIGYSTKKDFQQNKEKFPDPIKFLKL